MGEMTEDEVRNLAEETLGFDSEIENVKMGVGQLTTFNNLDNVYFKGIADKPDGWYFPELKTEVAIILETKNSKIDITKQSCKEELLKNIKITQKKYKNVVGILYNGNSTLIYKNEEEYSGVDELQNKEYYLSLFSENKIDKQHIYSLTKKINDCLHFEFGIKNLYHRMIFTACALVAERYDARLSNIKNMGYTIFHTAILSTLAKSLESAKRQNQKLDLLLEVYGEIKMNSTENQKAINNFIGWVVDISQSINSDYWNGEDVMSIFFNEFNRYKGKSESGQVFTPDHITSFMYRLINVNKDDVVFDGACGSGAFLVKSMCNMIKEAGGVATKKAKEIKTNQLYGIEFDRAIYALACANMLIHKDGKTNLEQLDTRTQTACAWIQSKPITKVLMNPPFENKYGCIDIVKNCLDSVPKGTQCAFILPDKKLEKVSSAKVQKILKKHTLKKIIKLPEKTFLEGITTSIFIFETGTPQNNKEIFACYIEEDGLETVKNQGRQDIRNKWEDIEDYWIDIINKQSGNDTIQWINPSNCLSYQMPKEEFSINEEDFTKTMMNYVLYERSINSKDFEENLLTNILYSSKISKENETINIKLKGKE